MGSRRAGSNGILSFQLQAKDSDTLHSVEKSLRGVTRSSPFRHSRQRPARLSFRASFDLLIPSDFEHDIKENLKTNTPPARIEDDIHAKGLTVAPKRKDPRNG